MEEKRVFYKDGYDKDGYNARGFDRYEIHDS